MSKVHFQCDCSKIKATVKDFPGNSPGRLMCYCDDCQNYLKLIGRDDLLDEYGGTEVIPVYPDQVCFEDGKELLQCNVLSPKGTLRWSSRCCNSPLFNTLTSLPWFGIFSSAYKAADPNMPESIGSVKCRIMGQYAQGQPPFKISKKMGMRAMLHVAPFMLRGKIFNRHHRSPIFKEDAETLIQDKKLLTKKIVSP